ncbi:aspartyl-tRNA synthetase [Wallemia mellicola]|uniref:Aspartate--tRNA ligase, cytoplasmic n=2 Tax=Wallemia mellicola TaxID=1708541 RepID=A0A4T0QD14_9BASI|nr:hypothetical protein E3Q23_03001 [Wallemia mellicola]TIB73572.1 hypothetical protein E3Q24_01005 [Wallemia mellicola]TIB89336.1 aspartyl-tRNA synthetase [Wallemia mellicola]TIB90424.1 aspartyl-tRNA synthetase [Wallemia mellicola]TIB92148.1 aspartyl-tRNA synthetase [Wallemia mellicola]
MAEEQQYLDENGQPMTKSAIKKLKQQQEKEAKKKATQERLAKEQTDRQAAGGEDTAAQNYGPIKVHSQERTNIERTQIKDIDASYKDKHVVIRARVQTSRAQGAKMVFFGFRQQDSTIQGVLVVKEPAVSKQMVKWAGSLGDESIVLIDGIVQLPKEPVHSATQQDAEISIQKIYTIADVPGGKLPFTIEDASRPEAEYEKEDAQFNKVHLETRLDNRVVDLRTQTNQAIFKIQSAICKLFRQSLDNRGFIEIHSPKLMGAASESGSSVFSVSYFKSQAFLAQSPQLPKQMCIAADFEKVYEIGPVFRAENSNTHRHMTEFTGLDLEMAFEEHYHEVVEVMDEMFKNIFRGLKQQYAKEIEIIKAQFPHDEFVFPEETVKLHYKEAIALLREAGREVDDFEDFNTETEKFLGGLVKEKYNTDYYILDKFPLNCRPFYSMPDPADNRYSNSYDFFMRGEEILSGAQRIHDPEFLITRMKEHGINPADMQGYLDAFNVGAPPHAGGGIGLERVLMLFLKLNNIRRASLFPRDPKRLAP